MHFFEAVCSKPCAMRLGSHSTVDINKVIHRNSGFTPKSIQINDLKPFLPKHLSKTPQLTA